MQPTVLIIGGGRLGHSLAELLSPAAQCSVWDVDPERATPGASLESAGQASFVLYCAPAGTLAKALEALQPFLSPECLFVTFGKGLDLASGRFSDQVLADGLPKDQPHAIIGGPMLAEELHLPTKAMAATTSPEMYDKLKSLFSHSPLSLQPTDDLRGVAVAGVIKNVYALMLGLRASLGETDNQRGCLLAEIINEMVRLGGFLGARPETLLGYAGLGDLLATGLSDHSANFSVGKQWAQGNHLQRISEGQRSLEPLERTLGEAASSYPIFTRIADIFLREADPATGLPA